MNRFEVVDSTGDEGYISLGSFPSLAEAIREIETETVNGPEGLTDIYDDECTINIVEHPDGWGKTKFVWQRTWVQSFENESNRDDGTWSVVEEPAST